ncbi:MAG: DUF3261 domain-containing protein, partial [Rhodocyclaceae bacterium]
MMRWFHFSFTGSLALLLASTACSIIERDGQCVTLIGGGRYCLQSSATIVPFEVQQKVEARFNGQQETMIVELEVDAAGMRFVGLTPFGHSLLSVNFDNRTVTTTQPADARLSPILLMALLQIALWPADTLRAGLEAPLRLEERDGQRRILNRDDVTLTINYIGALPPYKHIKLDIQGAAIQFDIETLP